MGFGVEEVERKACPVLSADSGMRFPLGWLSGNRIPVSEQIPGRSFRLSSHPESASHSECRFRDAFSAKRHQGEQSIWDGASVDGPGSGADAGSTSHLYLVDSLRGESACSLREPAPASAACRRPRPRAKNAYAFSKRPRPAQSSILRGTD